jgi:hypothetical protein
MIARSYFAISMSTRSSLLTKDHGLHALSLCRACRNLDFKSLSATSSRVHLKNCFKLIERSRKCRLCAFIAQTFQGTRDTSAQNQLVAFDIIPESNVPLCLKLNDGQLHITAGEDLPVAAIEIYSNEGNTTCRIMCPQSL